MELCVLRLCRDKNGDIGVGVFPDREEILMGQRALAASPFNAYARARPRCTGRLGTTDAELITATLLRAHGNPGSDEAIAQWAPHVARALKEKKR